jgi:assimilatory nitrate reductase catalytic subunit
MPNGIPGRTVATHCPYCALQCGMHVSGTRHSPSVIGNARFPVNKGGLCIKGWTAGATLAHSDRLLSPLVRTADHAFTEVSWDTALDRIARAFAAVQQEHGRNAVGVFGGGSLTNEKAYLLGKFARVALRTANIDYNGRFCMSSAAAAAVAAFGVDRGLPFPLADIARADAILLVGANVAETMPPILQYFEAQQANGGALIVVDPRRTSTAVWARQHLQLKPGSDAALANGLLHVLIRDGLVDTTYIRDRTEGFEDARRIAATYWPERVEQLTGVAEADLVSAAHRLGEAEAAMVLTARGSEQHAQGVNNTLAYINLALALGKVGRPFSGYGSLTGQGNGQGGREHGQKADQLPGYRRIDDPVARAHVAAIWQIAPSDLPGPGKSAYELLDSIGKNDGIRALLVVGSNPVVSAPNALEIERRLKSLDFLAVVDFFASETVQLADVVLPSAQWAEEDGTTTNLEGRVTLRRRAFGPPDSVRTDLDILCALASRFDIGSRFSYGSVQDVFDELRRTTSGGPADYSGMSYERIEAEDGIFWPCPGPDHSGTPRLFVDRFPTPSGRARFHGVCHQPPAEERNDDYPLYLTTGRILPHYQSGTQTRRIAQLEALMPEPLAEIHPATARLAKVADGKPVTVITRRGSATFTLKVTPSIREDTVFVPFHWGGERSVNRVTNAALDPTSKMPEFKVCAARVEHGLGRDEER